MSDVQWSAGISLFYGQYPALAWHLFLRQEEELIYVCNTGVVGYMISQLPGSLLLSRGKPRIIMPLMLYVPAPYLLSPCRRDLPLT
jgi:hypothetical protein